MLAVLIILGVLITVSCTMPSFDVSDIDTSVQMCDDCPNACSCSFYAHDSECSLKSNEMRGG